MTALLRTSRPANPSIHHSPEAAMSTVTPRRLRHTPRTDAARRAGGGPLLTVDGRRLLAARAEELRTGTLAQLRPLLAEAGRDERIVAEFERTQSEVDRLEQLLAEAGTIDLDADAFDGRIELGSRVRVELPDGEQLVVRLVHPDEAFLDEERISALSPLATALLGARAGHTVWVAAPTGPWPALVAEIDLGGGRVE